MSTVIQFRRGSSSQWKQANPVLLNGEPGIELDTGKFKLGTGTSNWKNLPYAGDQGPTGTDSTVPETTGAITYAPTATAPAGWLSCNGSFVSAATFPALQPVLPPKPGFSGGVGAQYGPGTLQNIVVSASSVASTDSWASVTNVDDGLSVGTAYPRNGWRSQYLPFNDDGHWLKFAFPIPTVINTYWLADNSDGDWSPTVWTFQGSNDNTSWTVLHTIDNGTTRTINNTIYGGAITTSGMANYSFTNTTTYLYYRWVFTQSNYGYESVELTEAAMGGTVIGPDNTLLVLPALSPISSNNTTFYPYIKS
jgi:hypothetical protein